MRNFIVSSSHIKKRETGDNNNILYLTQYLRNTFKICNQYKIVNEIFYIFVLSSKSSV